MINQCKTCGYIYAKEQNSCSWCNTSFVEVKVSSLDELILKQERLEFRHKQELDDLKQELLMFKSRLSKDVSEQVSKVVKPVVAVSSVPELTTLEEKPTVLSNKITQPENTIKSKLPVKEKESIKKVAIKVRKPSGFEAGLKNVLEPLYDGLDLVSKIYTKYKIEGKLPIFFMVIAGIAAILFGFGYLMQFTISTAGEYQGIIKVSLGFLAAFVSMFIGVRLSKRDTSLKEYGSALISLGVILNYVMIYYLSDLGNFPTLSNSLTGFLLIVANTGIAIAFALRFEAKIIAVLFIVGGAFTPFYLNADGDGRMYYLYLWFLTLGACYVSLKIKWKTLQYLAFSISGLLLQIVVFVEEPSSVVFTIYYHLFAYLFFYFTFFYKGKFKTKLDKIDLVVLSANLGFFSWNLFSAGQSNLFLLGITYLFNASLFVVLLLLVKTKLEKIEKLVLLVIVGLFVGLAIPSLFSQSLMGLFWSIEAVLLIYLGFLYGNEFIRKEGYFLLGLAFFKLGWHSVEIFYFWNQGVWHSGLFNYSILGLVVALCWALGQRYKEYFNKLEVVLFSFFAEATPVWLSSIFFIFFYSSIGMWSFPLSILPLFGLIYWSKVFKTQLTIWFAFGHLFLFAFAILISISETNSIHFLDQQLFAQFSVVELIAILWLLKSYFKYLNIEITDLSYWLASALRVAFFCLIPLLFIHFSRKIDENFIGAAIWFSVFVAYFLYRKLKHLALKLELLMLVFAGVVFSVVFLDLPGMVVGVGVLVGLTFLESSYNKKVFLTSEIKGLLSAVPYLLTLLVWFISFNVLGEKFSLSFSISAVLLLSFVMFKNILPFVEISYISITRFSFVLVFLSLATYTFQEQSYSPVLVILFLVMMGGLLYNKYAWYDLEKAVTRWNFEFALHQLLLVMGVSVMMDWLGIEVLGPILSVYLVIHAIVLVFIALKERRKFVNQISMVLFIISLLKILINDISDFSMPQKVIVFLILGLLLLAASYGYVKLKKRFEVDAELSNKIIDNKTEIE